MKNTNLNKTLKAPLSFCWIVAYHNEASMIILLLNLFFPASQNDFQTSTCYRLIA